MGKTCAFLGNDYDKVLNIKSEHRTPPNLRKLIRREVINLIENEDVDTFLVGEIGGYEKDAYDVVLSVQEEYPKVHVYLVISQMNDLQKAGDIYRQNLAEHRGFDDFILPIKCEFGYKKLCIVYRNRYIIENTDFIIAYNKYEGKAYEFCKTAQSRGVKVIELEV